MSNFIRLTALFAVTTSWLFAFSTSAQAQESYAGRKNPMVKTDHLPNVHFNTSPLQVDVIDENPIWHNCVRPPNSGANIDGMRVPVVLPATSNGAMSAPALTGLSGTGLTPGGRSTNPMVPNLNQLPQSGFGQSNIPSARIRPQTALPAGTVAHVMSHMNPPASAPLLDHKQAQNPSRSPMQLAGKPTVLLRYPDPARSLVSSSSMQTETSVKGKLVHHLIEKQR